MVEQTQAYSGLYFVLMGRLSPLDGIGPKEIRLERLLKRADRRHRARSDPRDQLHQRRRSHRALPRRAAAGARAARDAARARRAGRRRARIRRRRARSRRRCANADKGSELAGNPVSCFPGVACAEAAPEEDASALSGYFVPWYSTLGSHRMICGKMMQSASPSACSPMNGIAARKIIAIEICGGATLFR